MSKGTELLPALTQFWRGKIRTAIQEMTDVDATTEDILKMLEIGEPSLGCALTGELLRELQARSEVHGYAHQSIYAATIPATVGQLLSLLIEAAESAGYDKYRTIDENSAPSAIKGEEAHRVS